MRGKLQTIGYALLLSGLLTALGYLVYSFTYEYATRNTYQIHDYKTDGDFWYIIDPKGDTTLIIKRNE